MGIDIGAVASDAAAAILGIVGTAAKNVTSYAASEAKKLVTSAAEIAQLRATGQIDDEEMRLHLDIQRHASRSVLMAVKGVSIVAAEQAINAALSVIGTAIKTATGVALPV